MSVSVCWLLVSLSTSSLSEHRPRVMYTPAGMVRLTSARDVLVVRGAEDRVAVVAKKHGGDVRHLFADILRIEGASAPRALAADLVRSGSVTEVLAAYRRDDGEVVIADRKLRARFHSSFSLDDVRRVVKQLGGAAAKPLRDHTYEVEAMTPAQTVELAAALHEHPATVWAHPDIIYRKQHLAVPDDTYFDEQWHHDIIGSASAWDLQGGSADIVIAIIDSGTDMTHPDLVDKIVSPQDTLDQDDDPTPNTYDAHGTGTAGLAAASTNNAVGVAGVCAGCSIMPIRIMGEDGYGRYGADTDAFYWACDNGAQILSNSWGPAGAASVPYDLDDAIQACADEAREGKGALILFAAGNDSRENEDFELASHPLVVGVGASGYWDTREWYSNWGNGLDVASPAGSVTTDIQAGGGYANGDYFSGFGGTSAACPVAAGVAGLIYSVDPTLTRGQVFSVLTTTADPIGDEEYIDGFNPEYGHGRVNALRAVQQATGGEVCQPAPEDCSNGIDDDCDGIVDGIDTSCAPVDTTVGAECIYDYQCGKDGICIAGFGGYQGGYCTTMCEDSCPGGDLCVPSWGGSLCLDACAARADCREGYDCLGVTDAGDRACVPSCTVTPCAEGEMCDEVSGECYHDGPSPPAGPCADSVECSDDGRCWSESDTGLVGGFCRVRCDDESACGEGLTCIELGWHSACVQGCQKSSECRDGWVCQPTEDDPGEGMCWYGCQSDEDCEDGERCNVYKLCGFDVPPQTEDEPAAETPVVEDNDTSAKKKKKKKKTLFSGCTAAGGALSWLVVLGLGLRGRRSCA